MNNKDDTQPLIPQVCVWELTLACNMRCLHCGSYAGQKRDDELTTLEALQLCDGLVDLGTRILTLSGGEPLLRKDWYYLARYMTDRGVQVNMISNGYLINKETVKKMRKAGLVNVGVSIDGTEETHNRIRNVKDSYSKSIRGLEMMRGAGISTGCITQVNKWNIHQLEEIYNTLLDLEIDIWQLQLAIPMGRASEHDLLIEPKQIDDIAWFIVKKNREGKMRVYAGDNIGYYSPYERELRSMNDQHLYYNFWTGCKAGLQVIGVESNGNIKGCLSQPPEFVEGNIRKEPLRDIWFKEGSFAYNRNFKKEDLQGFCRECQYGEVCRGGCTWTAFATTGSVFSNKHCIYYVQIVGDMTEEEWMKAKSEG